MARLAYLVRDGSDGSINDGWRTTLYHDNNPTRWDGILGSLEEINIAVKRGSKDLALEMTKSLLYDLERLPTRDSHAEQIKAVRRRLTSLDVTHFVRGMLMTEPSLISEQDSETLGTGTYAVVDTVKLGKQSYARKAVVLPRYRQQQVRKAIQNELSILRMLDHPHIVRVYLTYEDRSRFFIVMEPLADCDLEDFLAQHSTVAITTTQTLMVCKWLLCLSSTLAYIHSNGVRHKDIKSRNILVRGEEVIFADFGSSHIFHDEGNSTTEGTAFGHTKMYCAPEVMEQGRRNRSADVFSLGCVFTELAVWLPGSPEHDIATWHDYRETVVDGIATNSYHASLHKVEQWFAGVDRKTISRRVYDKVLRKMLHRVPKERVKATEASKLIARMLKRASMGLEDSEQCPECRLDMWVDMDTDEVAKPFPRDV